jgi:hypothetical protein
MEEIPREANMRDIPVDLSGYRLRVAEAPAVKMRELPGGEVEPVVDRRTGVIQYAVAIFARPAAGGKGEEIRVTLVADPGEGFEEGSLVELVGATVSPYSFKNDRGEDVSGVAFRAAGLKPGAAARPVKPAA